MEKALETVMSKGEMPATPKEVNIFGASYIYPLFIRFRLVDHIGSHQRGGTRKGSKRNHKKERESCVDNTGADEKQDGKLPIMDTV